MLWSISRLRQSSRLSITRLRKSNPLVWLLMSLVLIPCRPDPSSIDPQAYVNPINSFAMSLKEFIPHISKVLETVGLSLQARTNFLKYGLTRFLFFALLMCHLLLSNHLSAFSAHRNIAYRLMSPSRLSAAINVSLKADQYVFTRIFLMFRGISDDERDDFAVAG